jgi:hypothetical protein
MFRRRLLVALQAEPGIAIEELRLRFPDAKVREIGQVLRQLEVKGLVEMYSPGKYRCVPQPAKLPSVVEARFIRPIPLSRLMANR